MLRKAGLTLGSLERRGLRFVAAHTPCKYLSSAYFDDLLKIRVAVAAVGASSVAYSHLITRGKARIAEGKVTDVLVGKDGR